MATEAVYFYAVPRGGGGEPNTITRRIAVDGGSGLRRLLLRIVTQATGRLEPHPAGRSAASSRNAVLREGQGVMVAASVDESTPGFAASAGEGALKWSDGDVLCLTGSVCGPGLWWAVTGMEYAGWMYRVSGRVLGQKVTGLAGVDQVRLRSGAVLYSDDRLLSAGETAIWTTFTNAFGDGAAEYGHALVAHDGEGFALVARDGDKVNTQTVRGTAEPDAAAAELWIDGEQWTYSADPTGLVPAVPGDPMVRSEGQLQRAGGPRSAAAHLAALEFSAKTRNPQKS